MERVLSFRDASVEVLEGIWAQVIEILPRVAGALVVLLLGLLVAKVSEALLRRVFARLGLEGLLQRAGVGTVLSRAGWTQPVCRPLERGAFYLILFLFVQQAARVLGLAPVSAFLAAVLGYAPRVFAALAIVVAGALLSGVFARLTEGGARGIGVEFAAVLGRIVGGATLVVGFLIAFDQLQIDSFLPQHLVLGAFLGLVLALALTFGLGSRDLSRNILAGSYARKLFEPGTEIELAGEKGELVAITPLHTLVRKGGKVVAIPNSVYLDEIVRS